MAYNNDRQLMGLFTPRSGIYWTAFWMLLTIPLSAQTQSYRRRLTTDIKEIVLENRLVSRKFAVDNGWLRTSHLVNLLTGENIVVSSPEFEIQLENESVLSSEDFVAEYYTHILLSGEVKRTIFTLMEKRQRLRLELEYTLGPNDFFVRKRVRVFALQKSLPRVLSISVEALRVRNVRTSLPAALSDSVAVEPTQSVTVGDSSGQPVFLNEDFFWGMEHPAGSNRLQDEIVRCTEYPGKRMSSSGFESHSVVAGVSPRGEVSEWFLRYVDTFRLAPRPMTIVRVPGNGSGGSSSVGHLLERKVEAIPKSSERPNERLVDTLVLDAGWWPAKSAPPLEVSRFLGDLEVAGRALRSEGVGLGLYYPLASISPSSSLAHAESELGPENEKIGAKTGCLADPEYREELKDRLKQLHRGSWLRLVRLDLDGSLCQSVLTGHGVEGHVLFQAATEALIEVLRFERSLNSDLYVSLVGRGLLSPWWLQYANAVGPEEPVRGQLRMDLSPRPRDWQIEREGALFQRYLADNPSQFPFSRLAASALQYAVEGSSGSDEADESWADAVAEYFGRGQDLTELALDPEQVGSGAWTILRRGLEWKANRRAVFRHAAMIGGAAVNGEPYGYLHWNGNQAIACLHNPSPSPRDASFRLPKSLKGPLRIFQTYPRCRVESQVLKAGDIVSTSLEGLETRVFEVNPEGALGIPLPQDTDLILSFAGAGEAGGRSVHVKVFPETPEIRFSLAQSVVGLELGKELVSLDSSGTVQLPDDPQMASTIAGLRSFTEKKAEVGVYAKRGAQLALPEWSGVKSDLAIWLFQPEERRGSFPLYITLDRKQVDLSNRVSFRPAADSRSWSFYSVPLKFERQVLLDWAVKDVKDVSLYLWWEITAPRPALEFTYRLASGRVMEEFPPLLSSPRGSDYTVRIPLEVEKPKQAADTP